MVLSMQRFVEKVAVVTGASAGIGAAIVEELVKNGVIVVGLARRVDRIKEQAQKLKCQKGKLHAIRCDMTKEEEIVSAIKQVVDTYGPIAILINNAGLMQQTDLINGDTDKWRVTLETNILGLCIATREAIQNMKATNTKGHIIHINSVLGHQIVDFPGINVYGASKYAVTALADTLRHDINREKLGIKVTSISPGYVKTEFQQTAGMHGELPFPGLAPHDVAESVIYALSTSPHVNVQELTVQAVGN